MNEKRILAMDLGSESIRAAVAFINSDNEIVVEAVKKINVVKNDDNDEGIDLYASLKSILRELSFDVEYIPLNAYININDTVRCVSSEEINENLKRIISSEKNVKINYIKEIFKLFNIDISSFCFSSISSALSLRSDYTLDDDFIVFDIGGVFSNISIYSKGDLVFIDTLKMAGNDINKDIMFLLKTKKNEAEKIKIETGCSLDENVTGNENIELIQSDIARKVIIPKGEISKIIQMRVYEIFIRIKEKLNKVLDNYCLDPTIYITGGSSVLKGMAEICSKVFQLNCRIGIPLEISGLSKEFFMPEFASLLGLLKYYHLRSNVNENISSEEKLDEKVKKNPIRFKEVFSRFF